MPTDDQNVDAGQTQKPRRTRGQFPRLPLKDVIGIPLKVREIGHGEPVRRRTVFEQMGKSADSSTSKNLINASTLGYKLTSGGFKDVYLELTPLGERIVATEGDQRVALIQELLVSNPIFAAVMERFNDRALPADEIVTDYLRRTQGLSEGDAQAFWAAARQNIEDFGFLEESGGKQIIVPPKLSAEFQQGEVTEAEPDRARRHPPPEDERRPENRHSKQRELTPQFHFNIQVVLPPDAPSEKYEEIFSSIAKHLLGRTDADS